MNTMLYTKEGNIGMMICSHIHDFKNYAYNMIMFTLLWSDFRNAWHGEISQRQIRNKSLNMNENQFYMYVTNVSITDNGIPDRENHCFCATPSLFIPIKSF
jgi:hypothetical protein